MPTALPERPYLDRIPAGRPHGPGRAGRRYCSLLPAPVWLAAKVLLPADVLFAFEPWRSQAAAFGVTLPHNDLIADAVLQNYGWKTLIKESLLHGELPLWNPSILGGVPLLAAGQPGALYPPGLLFFLLLPTRVCLRLVQCCPLLHWRGRHVSVPATAGDRAWGALLGALTFALAGFLVVSLQWPQVVSAAVWLPWLLLCLEWLFVHAEAQAGQRADERAAPWLGMPFWTLLGALAVWLTLLAGHIEIAFYVLFTGGAYGLVRLVLLLRRSGPGDPAAKVLLAGLLLAGTGMLMAAAQLAPFYEVLQQNFEPARRPLIRLPDGRSRSANSLRSSSPISSATPRTTTTSTCCPGASFR